MQLTYIYVHACKHRYSVTRSVKADYKDIFKYKKHTYAGFGIKPNLSLIIMVFLFPLINKVIVNDKSGPRTAIIKNDDKGWCLLETRVIYFVQ